MANQTALKLHTNPRDQVICDKYAHIYNYESGGASFNSGVSCKLIDGKEGMFTGEELIEAINPDAYYYSKTSLVEIENTVNRGGGTCWDYDEILKIRSVCNNHNLGLYVDGARIWNALVAKKETPKQYGEVLYQFSGTIS